MKTYDVIVVGQGVAGINSAIYAASEGLSVSVIGDMFGGQIYSSAAVENLFSQPKITGKKLIHTGYKQAIKFGAEFVNDRIIDMSKYYGYFQLYGKHDVYYAKSIILALGVQYKTLEVNGVSNHIGTHIHTGDNVLKHAQRCKGKNIYIVGGANSAGQAAVYLSKYANKVTMLVRSTLDKSMSAYLIDQIKRSNNIEVMDNCTINSINGEKHIETIIVDHNGQTIEVCDCNKIFVFIGAHPNTTWLPQQIEKDIHGYIYVNDQKMTTMHGVFAVGDIESGSVKRVATAIGNSAIAISNIHQYLSKIHP